MEDKLLYLAKTLSRTNRKDYENYVINRLYTRLNDLDIKPMTQKYVKRNIKGKNGYCLIDLYFPQFNIGVECDEQHHILQEKSDRLRTEDIIGEFEHYIEQRIIVYGKTIKEVNDSIDKVVEIIKANKEKKIKNGTFKKWEIVTPMEYLKDREKITIYDDIEFHTITEASNVVFGTNYIEQQHSYFAIKDKNIMAWFPQLAIEKNNILVASSNGWNNTMNDNKDTIFEYNEFKENYSNFDKRERITFMKMKNKITNNFGYKFLGIFRPVCIENGKVVYKRINTEFKIIKSDKF